MSFIDLLIIILFMMLCHFLCLHLFIMWNSDLFYDLYVRQSFSYYLLKKRYKKIHAYYGGNKNE